MKITFLGGADEVGASSLFIEISGKRILVDCGIRPSPKARWGLAGDQLPDLSLIERLGGLDAILVTHAHTDHTGALELVAERFPGAPVFATPPTIALTRVLHADARRIMQSRLEEEGELPLFDDIAVRRLLANFVPAPFGISIPLGEGLAATFYPAGHIAGAAMIGLHGDDGRLLISGDVSITPQRTVEGAKAPPLQPDIFILESTYGGRLHANRLVQERLLVQAVAEVVGAGGKVLIPAFALGRAQELLLILNEFRRRGELPETAVWADGMVRAICDAYASFPDVLPLPLQERMGVGGNEIFFDAHTRPVRSAEQRNALVWSSEPAVIVASSGMLAGGPSLSYARALAGQPQHAILLTGYQDEESPGRRLQELAERGSGTIRLGKDKVDVQCRLGAYSLSAHADEGQLLSLVETLNPAEVLLVHGDDPARQSLADAIERRARGVHRPQAGQTLEFRFARTPRTAARGIGGRRPLDLAALWRAATPSGGGTFTLDELAKAWWEMPTPEHAASLQTALAQDDLYFAADAETPSLFRARMPQQVEVARIRRENIRSLGDLSGQWVLLRGAGGQPRLARCLGMEKDHFIVEEEGEAPQPAWPEDLIVPLGKTAPTADILQRYGLGAGVSHGTAMEPNQALAYANSRFPSLARLRKAGYRLEQRILTLTFDFPEAARKNYAQEIAALPDATGWQVEVIPETNQAALNALVSEVLPQGWRIGKGPAIFRETKRVVITVQGPQGEEQAVLHQAQERFRETSGYELSLALANSPAASPAPVYRSVPGSSRWEINAALARIKAALDGSTLYRASLKGEEIVLSFISPQVGARYRSQIDELSEEVGWPLSINPQPNQGALVEAARSLLAQEGWAILKGPGIHPERAEVAVTLAEAPEEAEQIDASEAIEEATGYRLSIVLRGVSQPPAARRAVLPEIVEIPVGRIHLRPYHQAMAINPEKLLKAVERVRRMGQVTPPVQVRRWKDGYMLVDGLYRLKAALALGMERIQAVVE